MQQHSPEITPQQDNLPINTVPTAASQTNTFIIPTLIIVTLVAVSAAGYFAYQNSQLQQEYNQALVTPSPTPSVTENMASLPSTTATQPAPQTTSNWEIYSNNAQGYSIQHPTGWRKIEAPDWTGFGPVEIGEDVLWGVSHSKAADMNLSQIKSGVGEQFPDRTQTEEVITVDGLTATKIVTTTPQLPDWYSVTIVITNETEVYAMSNGALTDAALNDIITKRTGRNSDLSFEDFYSTFKINR